MCYQMEIFFQETFFVGVARAGKNAALSSGITNREW